MSTEENKALFNRFMNEVANKGNLTAIDELMSPDFVEHEELPPGTPPGREAAKYFFAQWRQGFPDGQVTLEKEIAEGDLVSVYETWRGTHTGEFFGIPASGKPVSFKVIDILRVANGKFVEHWAVADNLSLMQQIGAIPEPDEVGI
jgi:predicted ester cyclase